MIAQIVQVAGALLILIAYIAAQMDVMDQHSYLYLTLNFLGSLILGVLALVSFQLGFLMLETVWAAVSLWGVVQRAFGRPATVE